MYFLKAVRARSELHFGNQKHGMFLSMPVPMQIYGATDSRDTCPLTVSEGRQWLERYCREKNITEEKREKINVDFLTVVREGEQQDPDNRKIWRFSERRLVSI